jgi:hypothetical protein
MSFLEHLSGSARGQGLGEVRAVEDVLVPAAQRVLEGDPGHLRSGNSLVQLGELMSSQLPPGIGGSRSRR